MWTILCKEIFLSSLLLKGRLSTISPYVIALHFLATTFHLHRVTSFTPPLPPAPTDFASLPPPSPLPSYQILYKEKCGQTVLHATGKCMETIVWLVHTERYVLIKWDHWSHSKYVSNRWSNKCHGIQCQKTN